MELKLENYETPVYEIENSINHIYIKREDFIPFSFGGNKARKAEYFIKDFDSGNYDVLVTYGSSSSNHCRIIANIASSRGIRCIIISPSEESKNTFNKEFMRFFGSEIIAVPVQNVHETIENKLQELRSKGLSPYFIPGGGHGNLGTQAYVDCYKEIKKFEERKKIVFDYIFFATGTGTTQAGLICGQYIYNDDRKIIGISIARNKQYGKNIVLESINDYLKLYNYPINEDVINKMTHFEDKYVGHGYGKDGSRIKEIINEMMMKNGIPMDQTYVGKAYSGMLQYIQENNISGKNILFLHTGGTPLFFDYFLDGIGYK